MIGWDGRTEPDTHRPPSDPPPITVAVARLRETIDRVLAQRKGES